MSYRRLGSSPSRRPLLNSIPDHNLRGEDENYAYLAKEDDYIIHPHWKGMVQKATARLPRRIQRHAMMYLLVLVLLWIAWRFHFGPRYARYRQEIRDMDEAPEAAYGANKRPEFKDMIHLKTMDERHLPVGDKRLVVVGDVHGCVKELKELLNKVDFKEHRDHLILTGDIVAKGKTIMTVPFLSRALTLAGPDSAGVVSLAQKLGASCVRGNHEDKLLLTIAEMQANNVPLSGPNEKPDSDNDVVDEQSHRDHKRRKLAKQFTKDQVAWLKQCPVILRVGKLAGIGETVVVHAGLVPDIPLEQQDPYQVMNMRTIDLKTRMPSQDHKGFAWERFWNHRQKKLPAHERMTVLCGHDARRGKNIQKYSKGLDSSCVRGGHLTAMVIDAKGKTKYVQVKCKGYVK
jgi:hypothetical protein